MTDQRAIGNDTAKKETLMDSSSKNIEFTPREQKIILRLLSLREIDKNPMTKMNALYMLSLLNHKVPMIDQKDADAFNDCVKIQKTRYYYSTVCLSTLCVGIYLKRHGWRAQGSKLVHVSRLIFVGLLAPAVLCSYGVKKYSSDLNQEMLNMTSKINISRDKIHEVYDPFNPIRKSTIIDNAKEMEVPKSTEQQIQTSSKLQDTKGCELTNHH
eukprot:TRINITY_DN2904_c0_g1_i3.p1 TRINITY_DN2904_c0_g1~~TRINITY_DN2904_c0_g1_i3.p1  ORF type:complete len:213 (-),score=11.46 TRINITY_DN2904_c0_g1_i3:334-972(-)